MAYRPPFFDHDTEPDTTFNAVSTNLNTKRRPVVVLQVTDTPWLSTATYQTTSAAGWGVLKHHRAKYSAVYNANAR